MKRPANWDNNGNLGRGSHWIRDEKREAIYARDGWTCWACGHKVARAPSLKAGAPGRLATLDHVIPRPAGGSNDERNLATMCSDCNTDRGDAPAVTWAFAELGDEAITAIQRLLQRITTPLPKAVSARSRRSELPTAEAAE